MKMNAINFEQFYNVFSHRKASQRDGSSSSSSGSSSPAGSSRSPFQVLPVFPSLSSSPSSPRMGALSSFLPIPMAHSTSGNGVLTMFQALSYDAVLEILSFLTVHDLGRLAQVSRETRMYAEDDVVWRTLCKALEPRWCQVLHRPPNMVPRVYARPGEWKRVYHIELQRIALCSKFVGQWSEKWCDVNVQQSTLIESDGRGWCVTYKKNKFVAHFRDYDPVSDVLTFNLEGGDSGWSFLYKIKPLAEHHCQLTVFRIHDQKTFTGDFFRCTPDNQTGQHRMDNAMGTHL